MSIKLYNSLSKKVEDFKSINPGHVLMYSCGPTVYGYAHIGNWRAFTLADITYRVMTYNGYNVRFIMNLTDVGHLVSDGDTGEDKVEKAADQEGKSAKDITDFYIKHFLSDYNKLNLTKPTKFARATDYIKEQIELIQSLERKAMTYKTSDGIYFDTSKYPEYGQLSGLTLDNDNREARVSENLEKRNPTDFALWKFSPTDKQRWQEWDSPWGKGFPGWHIECSAMSMKELGSTLDIHTGGEDLKMVHHPNEIAQSECATGNKFVNYWLHSSFLQVDGGKMSKSLGNVYTIEDIEKKRISPLALRYFFMTAHHRSVLNFTWGALQSAETALRKLYSVIEGYKDDENAEISEEYLSKFDDAINDDLNMPKAMSIVWDLLKSDIDEGSKLMTVTKMDEILGFGFDSYIGLEIPPQVQEYAKMRHEYRKSGIWDKADLMRKQIENQGYLVEDSPEGYKIKRKI